MSWTPTTVSGYNATPPADDGSQTAANVVSWATIKTKLNDPVKTAYDANITSIQEFLVPSGAVLPFAGSSIPTGWLLCAGQAVSRSTYSALFTAISTTYGVGDGSTTFNLPDLRGRSVFGKDDMNGSAASRVTNGNSGITGTTLGATGGDERLHGHTHTASVTDPQHSHAHDHFHNAASMTDSAATTGIASGSTNMADAPSVTAGSGGAAAPSASGSRSLAITRPAAGTVSGSTGSPNATSTNNASTGISVGNSTTGGGASQNMPPAMILNYIIKV